MKEQKKNQELKMANHNLPPWHKLISTVLLVLFLGIGLWMYNRPKNVPLVPSSVREKPRVMLVIDFGGGRLASQSAYAKTAYEALINGASEQQLAVKTKQYDFGVFVESIGDKMGTQDYFWKYLVNGKEGTVAGDKQEVRDGDTVEWRYTKVE